MGQFSDDGQRWWDGSAWVATSQLVLPSPPPTEIARSGRPDAARGDPRAAGWFNWTADAGCLLSWIALIPYLAVLLPALRDYRSWTLQQLALATDYLLGADEPLLAGEATISPPHSIEDATRRDLAIAVTAKHVLLLRFDVLEGQPRWVVLVARPADVTIGKRPFIAAGFLGSALTVRKGTAEWLIRGIPGVWKPDAVLEAWRTASAQRPSA